MYLKKYIFISVQVIENLKLFSPILAILFKPFSFIAPKTLNYLAFQSFDIERTWWRLFQERVMRTKFDIYVFIHSRIIKMCSSINSNFQIVNLKYSPISICSHACEDFCNCLF